MLESSGTFWFLRLDTRLQLGHPVTESIPGVDRVRCGDLPAVFDEPGGPD